MSHWSPNTDLGVSLQRAIYISLSICQPVWAPFSLSLSLSLPLPLWGRLSVSFRSFVSLSLFLSLISRLSVSCSFPSFSLSLSLSLSFHFSLLLLLLCAMRHPPPKFIEARVGMTDLPFPRLVNKYRLSPLPCSVFGWGHRGTCDGELLFISVFCLLYMSPPCPLFSSAFPL